MHLKGLLILFLVSLWFPAVSQFKNVSLYTQPEGGRSPGDPSIVISPRNANNIVAGSLPANVYYTSDGGATWQTQQLQGASTSASAPILIADAKGKLYSFRRSGIPEGEEVPAEGAPQSLVFQQSGDGGATWSAIEAIGSPVDGIVTQNEVVIDGKGNLYLTWTGVRKDDTTCESNVFFSMSRNWKKWTEPVVLSQVAGGCDGGSSASSPAVTVDGKVLAAWATEGKIFLDRSFDGGDLWLSNDIAVATPLNGGDLIIEGYGVPVAQPVFATDLSKSPYRGSLYIVWGDQRNSAGDADIWFTRSHNFGDNWSSPSRVNNDGRGKQQYAPSMAVDPKTGYVYIVYYDRREYEDAQTDVYVAYSTDGGTKFHNVRVSEMPFMPHDGHRNATHIAAQGGVIAPVWTRVDDGKASVWTAIIKHDDLVKAATKK